MRVFRCPDRAGRPQLRRPAYPLEMSQWPELSSLEVLVAVADQGSLSSAARVLHMAQPNVSRSISRLERRLDLTLVRRATTGSTLTPQGLLMVEWARDLLSSAEDLMRNARALGSRGDGALTVCASQTIAEHLLPGWLAALRTRQPDVQVNLRITNTAAVLRELHSGDCDLGFVEGPVPPGSVHLTSVGDDHLALVVHADHPWATRTGIQPDELLDQSLITRETGSGTRRVLDDALGTPVVPQVELASNAAVRVAVLSGAGPAVLSRLAVSDALASGTLIELPIERTELRRTLRAAWTGPRQLSGPAGTLIEIATTNTNPATT